MVQLANYFVNLPNVEVHIILYGKSREIYYDLSDFIKLHKPPFNFNDSFRHYSTIKSLLFVRRTVKKIAPETVLSFGEVWNNFVLMALWGMKIPIYVSDRSRPGKDLGRMHNYLKKVLYKKASGIIAQTEKAKETIEKTIQHQNIAVIPNPVNLTQNTDKIQRENIVLTVGRLIDTKHHDRLINMFIKINDPDWKLIVVGDDAQKQKNRSKLQKIIHEAAFENQVVLAGKQKNIESYYLRSKIFAFTSSSEGFPNVVAEAMAAGLPVIAFDDVSGNKDLIIDNENGFLVPLFNDEIFKDKLNYLMKNEKITRQMGSHASNSIQKFNKDNVALKFYNFITDN